MKHTYCFLIILFQTLQVFSQEGEPIERFDSVECIIMKIDSIDHFYLINVLSGDNKYKIVSRKTDNSCYNIHVGSLYNLNLWALQPRSMNPPHERFHIGRSVFVELDWGHNFYYADELCGLCYESDSVKLRICKQLISNQEALESSMLYIYFFYTPKRNRDSSFINFLTKQEANSVSFTLYNTKPIPVYLSPDADTCYKLFDDTALMDEVFYGRILYKYKRLYFVQGHYSNNDKVEFCRWIPKKALVPDK